MCIHAIGLSMTPKLGPVYGNFHAFPRHIVTARGEHILQERLQAPLLTVPETGATRGTCSTAMHVQPLKRCQKLQLDMSSLKVISCEGDMHMTQRATPYGQPINHPICRRAQKGQTSAGVGGSSTASMFSRSSACVSTLNSVVATPGTVALKRSASLAMFTPTPAAVAAAVAATARWWGLAGCQAGGPAGVNSPEGRFRTSTRTHTRTRTRTRTHTRTHTRTRTHTHTHTQTHTLTCASYEKRATRESVGRATWKTRITCSAVASA